jgi:flavin reductase (DIM6/NTAB) family NADH-FMN oxidoreductase RutF
MSKENVSDKPQKQHRSLRDAFSQFATGVTVVTTVDADGKPIGLTANSFASVSLDPALVSWCVDKSSTRFSEFAEADYFSISVLTSEQEETSNLFASRSWDDSVFNDTDWYEGHHGVPQLPGCMARFHCKTKHVYEGGDHLIIVGAVEDYDSEPQAPLLFLQGGYQRVG